MYQLILPLRYLVKRGISIFAIAAVALCVFVALVVMTVLSGLTSDLKGKYHSYTGDCVIVSDSLVGFTQYQDLFEALESADFVLAASPIIKMPALVDISSPHYGDVGDRPVEIIGIEPEVHSRVTGFETWLKHHDSVASAFAPPYDADLPGCVTEVTENIWPGALIAGKHAAPVIFHISTFPLTPKGALAKAGAGLVNTKSVYLSDRADLSLPRIDRSVVYLPFELAQQLCGMDLTPARINEIRIKFRPGVDVEAGRRGVESIVDKWREANAGSAHAELLVRTRVQSWKTYNREVISALDTEQAMMLLVFALIGFIAVFIVFVVLYMLVSHKSKDIGILRSVGVSAGRILGVFLGFAFLLGVIATTSGGAGAYVFLLKINNIEQWVNEHFEFQLWDRSVYAIGDIPNEIHPALFAGIVAAGLLVCLLGALPAAIQAARQQPVRTLQVSQI